MGQYCDSQKLEAYWYKWILSSSVPELETFRQQGILYTKVIGFAKHEGELLLAGGKPLPDPSHPVRRHCLASDQPLFFHTIDGQLPEVVTKTSCDLLKPPSVRKARFRPRSRKTWLPAGPHFCDELKRLGYVKEPTTDQSWHNMLENIRNICNGISMRFRLRNEDEQMDLASDALLQVTNKLVSGKLVYMPGRAPVFNLLTTTTYRIMYSILNKKNSQRHSIKKLVDDAAAGILPDIGRSIRVPNIRT
jgi:hypothetical protein